jgi:hypothetical protein
MASQAAEDGTSKSFPQTLNSEQQMDVYQRLQDHLYVIFNAPCKPFESFPFKWKKEDLSVSITAIIEHFEENQQVSLIKSFNSILKMNMSGDYNRYVDVLRHLKASALKRHEGGIQFEVNINSKAEYLMEALKVSYFRTSVLWSHIKSYEDFINHCQIRYEQNDPFGNTGARVVTFSAYHGTPIFLMLCLLRQLEHGNEQCGFGQVIVIERNGLPNYGDDYNLHFCSGLIKWN